MPEEDQCASPEETRLFWTSPQSLQVFLINGLVQIDMKNVDTPIS